MAEDGKRLYLGQDGIVGGVCSGIACYFNVDAGIVRLIAVVVTLLTCGVGVLAYGAMWLVMPMAPGRAHAVSVDPQVAASDVYGAARHARIRATVREHSPVLIAGICAGVACAMLLSAIAISGHMQVFSAVQFWPMLVIGAGIACILVPSMAGRTVESFAVGVAVVAIGLLLLSHTLGLLVFLPDLMAEQLWPFALIVVGLVLLGRGLESPVLLLLAGLLVVAVCGIAMICYALPGQVQSVWVPLVQDYGFYLDFR